MEVRVLSPALAVVVLFSAVAAFASSRENSWRTATPLPVARTEVASARLGDEIVVIGGYLADGRSSGRVDAYSPRTRRWRRLPDLPARVNHAMAASAGGRLYVVGGYGAERSAFSFFAGRWPLAPAEAPAGPARGRGGGGRRQTAVRGRRCGGAGASGAADARARPADRPLVVRARAEPREHLAATASGDVLYALAGRSGGTNFTTFEAYSPARRRWSRLPAVPYPRGGTGAAVVGGRIVSVGGEEAAGTIASVYAYGISARRWTRLPDMRTPRHGLGVVSFGNTVYAIAGGPDPGLHVSSANEFLTLP